jgi:hypothetical protein
MAMNQRLMRPKASGRSEIQSFYLSPAPASGTYTITMDGKHAAFRAPIRRKVRRQERFSPEPCPGTAIRVQVLPAATARDSSAGRSLCNSRLPAVDCRRSVREYRWSQNPEPATAT